MSNLLEKTFGTIRMLSFAGLCALCMPLSSFAEETTLQKPTIIEGKIVEVVPSKKEIYVRNDEGKHEFYFNPGTTLRQGTAAQQFSVLQEGQKVRVTANKIGKRLDPLDVEILN